MKKRNLLVAALSLCLVAVIAVGGTLAYFTDQTQTMTNTFTSGEVDIVLWESGDPDGDGNPEILDNTTIGGHGDRTYTGIKFDDIVPGDVLDKSMNISVSDNSVFSYVAVRLWVEGEGLTDEQNALAYELIENAVTRRSVNCAGIPAMMLGLGVYLPFYMSLTTAAGALIRVVFDRVVAARGIEKGAAEETGAVVASGVLGGESIVGVIVAFASVAAGLAG